MAAKTGDVPALQAALDAGRSTEERDKVRERNGRVKQLNSPPPTRILIHEPRRAFIVSLVPPPSRAASLVQTGCTAFYWATSNGHLEALHTLLEAGANPTIPSHVRGGRGGRGRRLRLLHIVK